MNPTVKRFTVLQNESSLRSELVLLLWVMIHVDGENSRVRSGAVEWLSVAIRAEFSVLFHAAETLLARRRWFRFLI